jgi:hypothetical protein
VAFETRVRGEPSLCRSIMLSLEADYIGGVEIQGEPTQRICEHCGRDYSNSLSGVCLCFLRHRNGRSGRQWCKLSGWLRATTWLG